MNKTTKDVRAADLKVGDRVTSVLAWVSWPIAALSTSRGVVRIDFETGPPLHANTNALIEIETD